MGYIGNQNIIDRIGEGELVLLADNDGDGEADTERVNQAIDYAAGIFDAHIPTTYRRPISATAMVLTLNLDLAIYDFWKIRAEIDEGKWKIAKAAHDAAIKMLEKIQSGKATLDSPFVEIEASTSSSSGGFFFGTLKA